MEIVRIQPNCSECALVVYSDKLSKTQKKLIEDLYLKWNLYAIKTKKGNLSIELDYKGSPSNKQDLWKIADDIEMISGFIGEKIEREHHFDLIRDESYEEMFENGSI